MVDIQLFANDLFFLDFLNSTRTHVHYLRVKKLVCSYVLHLCFYVLHLCFYVLHLCFCVLHLCFCVLHLCFCVLHLCFCVLHIPEHTRHKTDGHDYERGAGSSF